MVRDRFDDEVTAARKEIVSPNPDAVLPAQGGSTEAVGKIFAVIAGLLLIGLVFAIYLVATVFTRGPALDVVVTNERVVDCEWQIDATIENKSDEPMVIQKVLVILDRRRSLMPPVNEIPVLQPGATQQVSLARSLQTSGCPAVGEINHGDLLFQLDPSTSKSVRF